MKDKDFLIWLYQRLVYVHSENPLMDYMYKLRAIIQAIPSEQETPNVSLLNNIKDIDPDFSRVVDENFWALVEDV